MVNTIALELEKTRTLDITEGAKNIYSNISEAFSNAVDKGIEILPIPRQYETAVKEGVKKFDFKTFAGKAVEATLKTAMKAMGMKASTFDSLKEIGEAIKNSDLKKGLSSVLDIGINSIKGVPTDIKKFIKSSKDLILGETFDHELTKVMTRQKNTIARLDKKCNSFEEAIKKSDIKTMDKLAKNIRTDLEKVMPIEKVIQKAQNILNQYELIKNKEGVALTEQELELCSKLA